MITSLRHAAGIHDDRLRRRLDTLIPMLMDRASLDAWVLAAREYNEDPVLQTMLPESWLRTARRRTIVVFVRRDQEVDRMAVTRYAIDDLFPAEWDPESHPDQWVRLAEILEAHEPARIGLQTSPVFPLADGLSASEHAAMLEALTPAMRDRLVSAEIAAVGWLETRLPDEIEALREACHVAHGFLRRALSPEVVTAGSTTTDDVEWWLRQTTHHEGLDAWFHPTCSVQRAGGAARTSFSSKPTTTTIEAGDLVHIDFGIVLGGLCTDQQQHGYVLTPHETSAPVGLQIGIQTANTLQDILMARFATGSTGNHILGDTRRAAADAGIDGLIYTHPIGLHGHAAGPTFGLWDQQHGVPGQGDYPVWPDTAYSIELQARVPVAEWRDQTVQFMLEEEAWFDGTTCRFLDGRQTELWTI